MVKKYFQRIKVAPSTSDRVSAALARQDELDSGLDPAGNNPSLILSNLEHSTTALEELLPTLGHLSHEDAQLLRSTLFSLYQRCRALLLDAEGDDDVSSSQVHACTALKSKILGLTTVVNRATHSEQNYSLWLTVASHRAARAWFIILVLTAIVLPVYLTQAGSYMVVDALLHTSQTLVLKAPGFPLNTSISSADWIILSLLSFLYTVTTLCVFMLFAISTTSSTVSTLMTTRADQLLVFASSLPGTQSTEAATKPSPQESDVSIRMQGELEPTPRLLKPVVATVGLVVIAAIAAGVLTVVEAPLTFLAALHWSLTMLLVSPAPVFQLVGSVNGKIVALVFSLVISAVQVYAVYAWYQFLLSKLRFTLQERYNADTLRKHLKHGITPTATWDVERWMQRVLHVAGIPLHAVELLFQNFPADEDEVPAMSLLTRDNHV
eukprot:m.149241 g.149241  ORF g.149241 m.149241 type:complete len:437 (+) comp14204_c0_seq1:181-1491(+)